MSRASFRFIRSCRGTGKCQKGVLDTHREYYAVFSLFLPASPPSPLMPVSPSRSHLILSELSGHVLFGSLQSVLQVSGPGFGFFHSQLSTLLRLSQLVLQTAALRGDRDKKSSILYWTSLYLIMFFMFRILFTLYYFVFTIKHFVTLF